VNLLHFQSSRWHKCLFYSWIAFTTEIRSVRGRFQYASTTLSHYFLTGLFLPLMESSILPL